MAYFTNLKRLWDELNGLRPMPICSYESSKDLSEIDNNDKMIQFLMGLNNIYDHVKYQILITEPLHDVNRAYAMVLSWKKKKKNICNVNYDFNTTVLNVRGPKEIS